jgi:hypothetical protein
VTVSFLISQSLTEELRVKRALHKKVTKAYRPLQPNSKQSNPIKVIAQMFCPEPVLVELNLFRAINAISVSSAPIRG